MRNKYTPANLVPGLCGLPDGKRQRRLILALAPQWFIDDSGSEPQQPIFVLAGFLASVESWSAFSNEWAAALAAPPKLDYFKMSEANSLDGQFSRNRGWHETLRDNRVVTLTRIIRKWAKLRVSASIRHDVFAKYLSSVPAIERNLATDNPYIMLFFQLISVAVLFADKFGVREPCDFIFDRQVGFSEEIPLHWPNYELAYKSSLRPDLVKLLGSPPIFRDDIQFLPLQAADLYAWQLRNHYEANQRIKNQTIRIPPNNILRILDPIPAFERKLEEPEIARLHTSLIETGKRILAAKPSISFIPFSDDKRERKRARRRSRKKIIARRGPSLPRPPS
jgi:hypothetical protein